MNRIIKSSLACGIHECHLCDAIIKPRWPLVKVLVGADDEHLGDEEYWCGDCARDLEEQ